MTENYGTSVRVWMERAKKAEADLAEARKSAHEVRREADAFVAKLTEAHAILVEVANTNNAHAERARAWLGGK